MKLSSLVRVVSKINLFNYYQRHSQNLMRIYGASSSTNGMSHLAYCFALKMPVIPDRFL